MLKLGRKHTCSVHKKTKDNIGMINKVKDFVTFGDIDDQTLKTLQEKRGQKDKEGKLKNYFHLSPPLGGFERKGIKRTFDQGGVVGPRRSHINKLIQKMI
jgi:large subunit ribosomal protein L30